MINWIDNKPQNYTLDQILYQCRLADGDNQLLLDSVSMADIMEEVDEILTFDALVSPYAKLQRKMEIMKTVMERAGGEIKPLALQVSEPFKQNGVAQVAAIFELSDGQTVTVYFHNPDVNPKKITPTDEMISWKWLLNRKDITIIAAPERGEDLNVRVVASRVMKLAEKNSAAFQRANIRRADRMQQIEDLKKEITSLEKELASAQHDLEIAKIEAEDRVAKTPLTPEQDILQDWLNKNQKRFIAVKKALVSLRWVQGADGLSMVDPKTNHAVIYQPIAANSLQNETWRLYRMEARGAWKPGKEFMDRRTKNGYAKTPQQFATEIDAATGHGAARH